MIRIRVKNTLTPALVRFESELAEVMIESAHEVRDAIAARAVVLYMRDAQGEPLRRDPADSGPLRILSGRLAQSVLGSRLAGSEQPESVVRVEGSSTEVRVFWVSLVPYARIQEKGGLAGRNHATRIPARPYIAPAVLDVEPMVPGIFDKNITELASQLGISR